MNRDEGVYNLNHVYDPALHMEINNNQILKNSALFEPGWGWAMEGKGDPMHCNIHHLIFNSIGTEFLLNLTIADSSHVLKLKGHT